MFTGIVEEVGTIQSIQQANRFGKRLSIQARHVLQDVKIGDSIAVNGICLTVTEYRSTYFTVDVMPETLTQTSLKHISVGSKVNLERAMQAGGRFGGHIVSGHIDGTAVIVEKKVHANAVIYTFQSDPALTRYMILRGSVTIDGISLTLINVEENFFSVSLIPHTTAITILGDKTVGDLVNIECDLFAKYVEKVLSTGNENPDLQEKKAANHRTLNMEYLHSTGMI